MTNRSIRSFHSVSVRPSKDAYQADMLAAGAGQREADEAWDAFLGSELYESEEHVVQLIKGAHKHLSGSLATFTLVASRKDGSPINDWREIQEIKNCFVGPEVEAVELFPAAGRRYDFRNRTVLFCYVGSTDSNGAAPRLPFGAHKRFVTTKSILPHCQQRGPLINVLPQELAQ